MIQIDQAEVTGWEAAIRGMRNPMNSWDRSDSTFREGRFEAGPNDLGLMRRLAKAGPVDGKFRRMIVVYADITAPLYWWKEFDTYKVGTVANSCSTMHKIHAKEFTMEDFSYEHIEDFGLSPEDCIYCDISDGLFFHMLERMVEQLNVARNLYLKTNNKLYWWQMIQLLPSSYNQKRTVMLNYEVLANIYQHRRNHKLDEWREFCKWIETLPYSEIITGKAPIPVLPMEKE